MEAIKKVFDKILAAFCIFLFSTLVVLVTWQVFTRLILNNPSTISEELAKVFFVWLVLFGAAYVFGERGHMNVVFLADKLPEKGRLVLEIVVQVIIIVFAVMIFVGGGATTVTRNMTQMSPALTRYGVSMGMIYLALPISGVLIALYSLINIYTLIQAFRAKSA